MGPHVIHSRVLLAMDGAGVAPRAVIVPRGRDARTKELTGRRARRREEVRGWRKIGSHFCWANKKRLRAGEFVWPKK